ncbi:MAG: pectate lyase [Chthoniobacteraceae bacterium]
MKLRPLVLAFLAVLPLASAADADLPDLARATLAKATTFLRSLSAGGGYLWRYSADLTERAGEKKATATMIWIQPPGTPSIGMAFLRALEATGDMHYLEAALAAGIALADAQLESGGWDYSYDFDPKERLNWQRRGNPDRLDDAAFAKAKGLSIFDDDNTQGAIRFLLALYDAAKGSQDPRLASCIDARDYALTKMLEAQYPNGAFPQRWDGRPRKAADFPVTRASIPKDWAREWPHANYNAFYTLNDNAHRTCVETLLDAHHRLGNPSFRDAALRGGEFLLLAQLPEPQPVWAQQYNTRMEPDWARAFEPPCVTAGESVGALRLLLDLWIEAGDTKWLKPIPPAIGWFERSAISPGKWARMYELGTNKPIYGDRDGKIYHRLEDISEERRTGYSWQGDYGFPGFKSKYESVQADGREKALARRTKRPLSEKEKSSRMRKLDPDVEKIIAALDDKGRWLTRGKPKKGDYTSSEWIETDVFIANVAKLAEYLELTH